MNRVLALTFAVTVATTSLCGVVFAGEADHDPALLQILSLIDMAPDRAALVRAGAGEDGAALVRIALDEELERYPRMRAVHALSFFDPQGKSEMLQGLAFDRTQDVEVRIAAIFVLTSPPPQPSDPLAHEGEPTTTAQDAPLLVRALFADPHPEIQAAALRAVGRMDPEVARPIVEEWARLPRELEPRIHRLVERTLDDLR